MELPLPRLHIARNFDRSNLRLQQRACIQRLSMISQDPRLSLQTALTSLPAQVHIQGERISRGLSHRPRLRPGETKVTNEGIEVWPSKCIHPPRCVHAHGSMGTWIRARFLCKCIVLDQEDAGKVWLEGMATLFISQKGIFATRLKIGRIIDRF